MSMTLPKPNGPMLAVGALLIGAMWFMSRRAAAAPAGSAASLAPLRRQITPAGRIDRTQTYANPQTMGELLARSVNRAFGVFAPMPDTATAQVGSAEARDALRRSEAPGYYGWTGPVESVVDPGALAMYSGDPYHGGDLVDSIPAAPVYDVSTDVDLNPWALMAP